jgi:teichoic acid transport system permease protein
MIKRYSGAALGWAWTLIKPAVTIFVLWFAFGVGLRIGGNVDDTPFILWLIAGYVPWFYMSDMITGGAGTLRKYSYLVTKMKFPVSVIPTFVSLAKFAVHLLLMLLVVLIYIIFGRYPDIYLLQLPIYMALMFFSFTVWSLFASMLGAMSKDFINLVHALSQAVFWMSGIIWDINSPHFQEITWLQTILMFNPVTFFATGYRNCFIYKTWIWDDPRAFLCFIVPVLVVLVLAIWAYRKLVKEVPDVL